MSTITKVSGKSRQAVGSTACRRMRNEGLTPANVYGLKAEAALIALASDEATALIRSGARVVELEVDGKVEQALVKDVQWDTFSSEILHLDFLRVDANQRVKVDVPLTLRGTAPGVVAGGVLEIPHHNVTIECLAVDVPDQIQVRISSLAIGDSIYAKDLTELPAGAVLVTEPETLLVHVAAPQADEEESAAE